MKRFREGSYTVEAAVIMSLIILMLGSVIAGAFCLHDRVVCLTDSLYHLRKIGYIKEEPADETGRMTENKLMGESEKQENDFGLEGLSEDGLFMGKVLFSTIKEDGRKVTSDYFVEFPLLKRMEKLMPGVESEVKKSLTLTEGKSPETVLRILRGFLSKKEREENGREEYHGLKD